MNMDNFMRNKAALFCFLFGSFFGSFLVPASAQTSFALGEAFLMRNQPQEALELFEAAVAEDPDHVQAFIYLGITYQQLGRIDDAIGVYQRILPRGGLETARIAFNLGNAYLIKGNPSLAVENYTYALEADPLYSAALLNRANALVQIGTQESLREAIDDYEYYLFMEPNSLQANQITRLVSFIKEEFAAQERRRQEEIAAEEQARLAVEEAARQVRERWQRFLDGVRASVQAGIENTRRFSAFNVEIEDDEDNIEELEISNDELEMKNEELDLGDENEESLPVTLE
jgi:tetratricopeptide (TPR) repeat protein